MSQFTPLCLDVFGAAWFQRGSLSVHFLRMVSHLMPIQAHIRRPEPGQTQVDCWITFEDGELVLQGTASCGERRAEDGPSMVEQRLAKVVAPPNPQHLRILRGMVAGDVTTPEPIEVCVRDLDMDLRELGHGTFPYPMREKLKIITEPHPWFEGEEADEPRPWDDRRPILPPESAHSILYPQGRSANHEHNDALGLLGGCELRMIDGPVFVGQKYLLDCSILAVGETPRTEFYWTRSVLRDPSREGAPVVAEMDLQSMSMKNSSELYADEFGEPPAKL